MLTDKSVERARNSMHTPESWRRSLFFSSWRWVSRRLWRFMENQVIFPRRPSTRSGFCLA